MTRLSLSQIQRLKEDKSLRVQDVIKPFPDYTTRYERIKLFICGIIIFITIIIFATVTLFSILSKVFDFDISDNSIKSIPYMHEDLYQKIHWFIGFLKQDWHYCLLIPILIPWSVVLGWLGWIGFKLYRHN